MRPDDVAVGQEADPAPALNRRGGPSVGLYMHVPFCASHCAYCTFVTTTERALEPRTMAAVGHELGAIARSGRRRLETVYLGGGTPSLLGANLLTSIFKALQRGFSIDAATEVTIEANPDDVNSEKVKLWRTLGVTRVSLGVQSFADHELQMLCRRHTAADGRRAAATLLDAGFVLSVDVMLALPGGRHQDLDATLAEVVALRPHHVSVYLLEMDKPHALVRLAERRPDLFPDADAGAAQYLRFGRGLVSSGYRHYEISNFCRPGFVARHNTRYWLQQAVLAVGPAAHGQAGRRRWANVEDIVEYCELVESGRPPRAWSRRLDDEEELKERVMLGLRLARGAAACDIEACAGREEEFGRVLGEFLRLGLARRVDRRVRLAPRGWLVSNELLSTLW